MRKAWTSEHEADSTLSAPLDQTPVSIWTLGVIVTEYLEVERYIAGPSLDGVRLWGLNGMSGGAEGRDRLSSTERRFDIGNGEVSSKLSQGSSVVSREVEAMLLLYMVLRGTMECRFWWYRQGNEVYRVRK